jgi:ligand-binding sensor domain-containing protein
MVWAATDDGLVRWSADGQGTLIPGSAIDFPDDETQTVAIAPDGSLWIGAGGVSHVEATDDGVRLLGYYNRDDDLGLTRVRALLVDDDGIIWAGGPFDRESPLSWFDGQAWHYDFAPLAELAQENLEVSIWSLLRSTDGSLWLGLVRDGILRWDGENWRRWGTEEGVGGRDLEDARIRALFQDDTGAIWAAASDRGLLRYRPEAESWEQVGADNLSAPVTAITQFSDGSLWAGGEEWVARSDDSGATWTLIGTSGDGIGQDISGLAQDDAGRVWIGAYEGGVSLLEDGAWRDLQQ